MSLYDQYVGTGAPAQTGAGSSSQGYAIPYVGSIPSNNAPVFGPPPPSSIPFWDVPPATLGPSPILNPWDQISFGGQPFPGLARVRSKKKKRVDVKKKRGSSAATMTFVGYDGAEVEVMLTIWAQDQFNLLQSLIPMLLPKPGAPSASNTFSPVDISYPSLALMNISSVVILAVDALEPGTPHGVWVMKIHCVEYLQPRKTASDETATPTGSGLYTANAVIKSGATAQAAAVPKPSQTNTGPGQTP